MLVFHMLVECFPVDRVAELRSWYLTYVSLLKLLSHILTIFLVFELMSSFSLSILILFDNGLDAKIFDVIGRCLSHCVNSNYKFY